MAAAGVLSIQCLTNVVLEERSDDGSSGHTTLSKELHLKKEIGNARLVSGDVMLWVGAGLLSIKDAVTAGQLTREVRVENGKRSFAFTIPMTDDGKQFMAQLKEQIDGKTGLEIKKKKRKIRKQLSQAMGFVPVNTLKSPTLKPPATPTKPPMAINRSPRLGTPLSLSVASMPDAHAAYPSPSKSPYRSPFRKKPIPRQGPSIASASPLSDQSVQVSPRVREWLSPVRSLKLRPQLTPRTTPESGSMTNSSESKTSDKQVKRPAGGIWNKRVRSLQSMLESVPKENESPSNPQSMYTSSYFPKNAAPANTLDASPMKTSSPAIASPIIDGAKRTCETELSNRDSTQEEHHQPVLNTGNDAVATGPHKSTHGLLNLGNYCYMNSILQSLTSLPQFMQSIRNEEWVLKVIRKHIDASVQAKSLDHIKTSFDSWRKMNESKRLALQSLLSNLLQQIIDGSETSINPEPLKNLLGRRNSMFATHLQQDAHEFLLNLVNEYEKELVEAVKGVTAQIKEDSKSTPPTPKRSSLLNFFRGDTKRSTSSKAESNTNETDDFIGELSPAKCFRAELYRTLTCKACQYSRKQVETFYDFSLDLPFRAVTEPEPMLEDELRETPKRCFCETDALIRDNGVEKIYSCAKSACSFRETIKEEPRDPSINLMTGEEPSVSKVQTLSTHNESTILQSRSIPLESLLQKQFEPETLELTCEKCKVGKEATSAYVVKSLPAVLILHLKRFEVHPRTGALFKRCDLVEAPSVINPVQNINRTMSTPNDTQYTLKSVVHHLGKTVDEGHYLADVCDSEGIWRRRNDTHESQISEDYVLRASRSQESCYMLFYVRSETENIDKENVPVAHHAEDNENSNHRQNTTQNGFL